MITATVVCWVLLLSVGVCQEAVLTPSEYVAYEGQPEVTFRCTVTLPGVPVLVVLVDGEQLSTDSQSRRGITLSERMQLGDTTSHQRNITIAATQLNENTTIECYGIVSSGGGTFTGTNTAIATFKVQGLLAPVADLTSEYYNDFNQNLTWTPPFTLDITDLDPDVIHRVCVCNNDTNTCVDTTDTSYNFPTICFPVEYRVIACNPVGCSEAATEVYPIAPFNFTLTKVEFMYNDESEPMVHIEFKFDTFCLRIYNGVLGYLLGSELDTTETGPIEPVVDGKTHTVTLTQANGIVENANYTGQIGSEGMMSPISFLTFDVQDVDATYEEGGTIIVTCTFARGSNAQGCLVKFRNLNGLDERIITLLRQPSVPEDAQSTSSGTMIDLPDGEYEVVALDVESDGSVATNCEPMKGMYTFPPPTSAPLMDISSSSPDTTPTTVFGVVGALLLVTATVVVAVIVTAVCVVRRNKNTGGIEMRENASYEMVVTRQQQQKVAQMERCPAYEVVRRQN